MRHIKDPKFQPFCKKLPVKVRARADKSFALLKTDPKHPLLHFKCIRGDLWSARIGLDYRALAIRSDDRCQ
jgi:hypothetical protein